MSQAKVDLMAVTSGETDERVLKQAETQGKKVKALGLCAPHNQFGWCYSVDTGRTRGVSKSMFEAWDPHDQ